MKIIFNGYKGKNKFDCITIGGTYNAKDLGGGYYSITDDDGMSMIIDIKNYDIEFINEEYFIKEPTMLKCSVEEPASLKYFINGNLVTKGFFYESLGELNEADRLGAKVSSVKFEIKFE